MKITIFLLLFIISIGANAQSTASKNVSTFLLKAPQLDTVKKIWVYTPKSYKNSHKAYPVLYLQDAQNLFDKSTSYVGEWRIDETLDSLHLDLIVVGIEHGNEKRIDELTPFPNEKYGGGKAENYLDFLLKTLKPEIDKKYRTKTGATDTFIGGSSLGGLFAYYSILKYPDIFSKALVFSPSFWFSEKINDFTDSKSAEDLRDIKIYFSAGEKESDDMVLLMKNMKKRLIAKGLNPNHFYLQSIPNAEHNEKQWAAAFPKAALWLMKD